MVATGQLPELGQDGGDPGIILHDKVVDMQTKKVVKHGQSMLEETVTTFLFIITMKQGTMNNVITL